MEDLSHYNPEGSVMRKTQTRLLEILDVFDVICKRNGIDYWLDWGSLLGARRHSGFIPWDDDLDVAVLQKDYKRLVAALQNEMPPNLKLQTRQTDSKYWYYYPRIRDTKSRFYNKKGDVFQYNGIFFDVFLLEPVPSMRCKKIIDYLLLTEVNLRRAKTLYENIKFGLLYCFKPVGHAVIFLLRAYYQFFGHTDLYAYTYGANNYTRYNFKNFFPVTQISFEGKKYNAPNQVDQYLKDQFGETYMQLPDERDRYSHASNVEFF